MTRKEVASWLIKIGCILFCVSLPLSLQLNNLSIGLIVLGWLIEGDLREKIKTIPGSFLFLPIGFYLLHVVGLLYSTNITYGLKDLETKAAILLLPLTLGTTQLIDRNIIRLILKVFILTNLTVCLYCLALASIKFVETGVTNYFYYHSLTEGIDLHAIYFAVYLGFSILIILYFNYLQSDLFNKWISLLLMFFFMVYIALLSALNVMFILPLLMLFILSKRLLHNRSIFFRALIFASAFVAFILVAYALPYTRMKLHNLGRLEYSMGDQDYKWGSLSIRLAKWECGWAVVQKNWMLGVGTGDGQAALMESYREKGFSEGLRNNYNTHNQYLETWIMLGLPGLILLLLMLWPWHRDALWVCFLILIFISFLTENMLDTQKGVVFFSFFYALLTLFGVEQAQREFRKGEFSVS